MWCKECPYEDRVKYAELQAEKPGKGFLTSDYSKRDEFSSTIRTEQYRSLLKVSTAPFIIHDSQSSFVIEAILLGTFHSRFCMQFR